MQNKIITLVVAPSGAGKTSICNRLSEKYGMKQVWSYTTRPPRCDNEIGHIFISEDEMPDRSEMCAYTLYNGHHYFATHEQVDNADLYVIDPAGVEFFLKSYTGYRVPRIVKIDVPRIERMKRMIARGDSEKQVVERCEVDKLAFRPIRVDARFTNDDLETCVDALYHYICEQESSLREG